MSLRQWLLPDGIEELLPAQAARFEALRRCLLDVYQSWGYELVMPPFIEYLDTLLAGIGKDLRSQTFQLPDQLTGRMLGIRADMTPQVARIDARHDGDGPLRLCYLGTVLQAKADGFAGSRSALQVGAELYGHFGVESDAEIIALMLETLSLTGIQTVHLDLGHVGIFRSLAAHAQLTPAQETVLFGALQRKAVPEIKAYLASLNISAQAQAELACLVNLYGEVEVLAMARQQLATAPDAVHEALDYLQRLYQVLLAQYPNLKLYFDLAELRGYQFHTGVVYAAFTAGYGKEIARGGRYDDFGAVFGRGRPATGFSTDLKALVGLAAPTPLVISPAVLAPSPAEQTDDALKQAIHQLRQQKVRVICALPGQIPPPECTQVLQYQQGSWQVVPLV